MAKPSIESGAELDGFTIGERVHQGGKNWLALFEKVVKLSRSLSEESYVAAMNVDEPGWLADLIASTITLDHQSRQQLLETADPIERLQALTSV